MNPEATGLMEEVLSRIDTLANKLGTTADKLWGILVHDLAIRNWISTGFCFITLTIVLTTTIIVVRAFRKSDDNNVIPQEGALLIVISGLIQFVLLVLFISFFLQAITPELSAVQEIMKQLGK